MIPPLFDAYVSFKCVENQRKMKNTLVDRHGVEMTKN